MTSTLPLTEPVSRASRPRVVGIARVFNREAFLPRWLDWMALFVDEVVVIDDGSNDVTLDILDGHRLVTEVVRKKRSAMTEVRDLNRLTTMARDHGADWIVCLATDEVLDHRIFARLDGLLAARDVAEYRFRKYWLWRSEDQIRVDRPEKFAQWNPSRFFRAHPDAHWPHPDGPAWMRGAKLLARRRGLRPQTGNVGVTGIPGRIVEIDDVVLVHYAAVDFYEMQWKNIRYALGERDERPRRDPDEIATWASSLLDERTLELAPVPDEWKPLA